MKILIILIFIFILLSLGITAFIFNAVKKTPVSDCEKMMKIYEFINTTAGYTHPIRSQYSNRVKRTRQKCTTGSGSAEYVISCSGTLSGTGSGSGTTSGTGSGSGEITLVELKKQDPECSDTVMSKLLDCTKKNYNLDKLYNIVLKKDFTNSELLNYKNTYNSKCNGSGTGSGSGSGSG
tara:strand:+ start:550 stop:1086 length:537 start_codon:yes stop_codon:yes gene_type:complete